MADDVPSLDKIGVVDAALLRILEELGASAPELVYTKRLFTSDRLAHQARLLMSCKSYMNRGVPFPLEERLTPAERPSVEVRSYDRHGRPYDLTCRKLECNSAYRLIGSWREFLEENGIVFLKGDKANDEVVTVELWVFRSPLLPLGKTDQPGGALGLVVVHYRQGEAVAALPPPENIVQPMAPVEDVAGAVTVVESDDRIHEQAGPVLKTEDDVGHGYEEALPPAMDADLDVSEEDLMDAAIGLIMLGHVKL